MMWLGSIGGANAKGDVVVPGGGNCVYREMVVEIDGSGCIYL